MKLPEQRRKLWGVEVLDHAERRDQIDLRKLRAGKGHVHDPELESVGGRALPALRIGGLDRGRRDVDADDTLRTGRQQLEGKASRPAADVEHVQPCEVR